MFKKLRNSIMIFSLLSVSLIMLTAFSVIYLVTHGNIEQENQQRLRAVSAMFFYPNRIRPGSLDSFDTDLLPESQQFSVEYGVSFVLFVKDGRLENVNSQLDFDDSVYAEAYTKIGTEQSGRISLADRKWIFIVAPALSQNDEMRAHLSMADYTRIVFLDITNGTMILRTLIITLACVGVAVLLALLWISYRFAVRTVRPIEENYNKQKQFITDASHELRTPLAVISSNVDAITSSGGETVDTQEEWFGYIRAELKRTTKLVNDLLYLAKSENIRKYDIKAFCLSEVCEKICASMEAVFYEKDKYMETAIASDVTVVADEEKISQILYILLDNAGKYTPEQGHIKVVLFKNKGWAVIRVSNTGGGIDASDLPRIFDRFYRVDTSRAAETGGSGLGLSIAKTIVEHFGGTITVKSADGTTTFEVKLRCQKVL
jgi:signal transduction histidine kinase